MKLRILGSGGGEGFPAPFCCCDHCETARRLGGKSLRSLSQSIIDDALLIDFPADTPSHCMRFGVRLGNIENILITHSHGDHYMPQLFSTRGSVYAHNMQYADVHIYGPKNLKEICDDAPMEKGIREHIHFEALEFGVPVQIGTYKVTPLKALHAPDLGSMNYIIERDGKTILYLLDSGYPTKETLAYLQELGKRFDLVVMDATAGTTVPFGFHYHMGYEENKMLKKELESLGLADGRTQFVVTHITHNLSEHHEAVEAIFAGTGIQVAYDGWETEV